LFGFHFALCSGTQTIGGYKLLTVEGLLFGVMTAGIVLTLRVVGELWRPAGGAYNVDAVLAVMVSGLEEELKARMSGKSIYKASRQAPSASSNERQRAAKEKDVPTIQQQEANLRLVLQSAEKEKDAPTIQQQGANVGFALPRIYQWARARFSRR
jgi:hypothetical protein